MLEEATTLCLLANYENTCENYKKALEFYKKIRINTNDKELYYLTKMNEGIIYLDLTKNQINVLKNCKKSIRLFEESINYFKDDKNAMISFFKQQEAEELLKNYEKNRDK